MLKLRSIIAAVFLLAASTTTHAYTECGGKVAKMWVDDSLWVWFDNGLFWMFVPDPTLPVTAERLKKLTAIATIALVADKTMVVRFVENGVSCGGDQTGKSVWGVELHAN